MSSGFTFNMDLETINACNIASKIISADILAEKEARRKTEIARRALIQPWIDNNLIPEICRAGALVLINQIAMFG